MIDKYIPWIGVGIALCIIFYTLYKIYVIDFVDKEQEPTWRDEIEQCSQQLGCPFDESIIYEDDTKSRA